jgi:hypothetical protein
MHDTRSAPVKDPVTLLRPDAAPRDSRAITGALPQDLLDDARRRVRLLAALVAIAAGFDPILFLTRLALAAAAGHPMPPDLLVAIPFQLAEVGEVALSVALWLAARRLSATRLFTLGLVYEVIICFAVALTANWQYYLDTGQLPNMTWVPVLVILFPLVMPGPPRRMLAGAIVAGATAPGALVLLSAIGKVQATADAYARFSVHSAVAVLFAYMGARVVYGLGRQVAEARELGSYRLEERLGQGGMGEVWRARHRMLARPAAIKVIQSAGNGQATDEARRRFEREAQVTAGLRSPHTVTLFDFGVSADGAFYYVMELLDGIDLQTLVSRFGPLPAERVVHVLRQVCHSLSEAHAQGVVHRDIKPANILLCRYGEEHDFVKVVDFGLVKALNDLVEPAPGLTRENMVPGTPGYIAPEQALGLPAVDHRIDIYAVGCVAYWLLTGQLVFTGRTPLEVMTHHARTPAAAPSTRTELPIPAGLDRLVLSCLEKDPHRRPQSARALAEQLSSTDGDRSWSEERARAWWTTNQP